MGVALSDRRHEVLPYNLDAQLFLHTNKLLWCIKDVQTVLVTANNEGEGENDFGQNLAADSVH